MSGVQISLLVAEGIVFLVWAGMAFRTLFRLRARAQDRTGRFLVGPITFINTTSDWLRDPEEASERRLLLALTLVLFALIAAAPLA